MTPTTIYDLAQWPGQKIRFDQQMVIVRCPECHIPHGIPNQMDDRLLEFNAQDYPNNTAFAYCPNGHQWHYRGGTSTKQELKATKERLERAEAELAIARQQRDSSRRDAERADRSARAQRGHLTRIKNRIAAGICPVNGCRANLGDRVRDHIAHQHPTYRLPEEIA